MQLTTGLFRGEPSNTKEVPSFSSRKDAFEFLGIGDVSENYFFEILVHANGQVVETYASLRVDESLEVHLSLEVVPQVVSANSFLLVERHKSGFLEMFKLKKFKFLSADGEEILISIPNS